MSAPPDAPPARGSDPAPDKTSPPRSLERWALVACVLGTFLVWTPTLRNGFLATWDDGIYVLGNAHLALSLDTVRWAFTEFNGHYWAPLTGLSFAVDHAIWGAEPFGYHLTNVLCHSVSAGLVFAIALTILSAPACAIPAGGTRVAAALLASLVWSLHPLRVESVAWISERKDVLAGALGLAAVLAYLRHATGGPRPFWRSRPYALALGLVALSLAAKTSSATVPIALLLVDGYPLRRFRREGAPALLLEKAPWIVLVAGATLLTVIGHAGASRPLALADVPSAVLIGLRSTWDELRLVAWPSGLSPFHLQPPGRVDPRDPAYLGPAAGVVLLALAAVLRARRHPASATAFLAFLALLLPGLAAARVSLTSMADRFTYLPAVPVSLLAAGGAVRAVALRTAAVRASVATLAVAGLTVLAGRTVRQIGFWHDDVSLWTRAIDVRPHFSGRMYAARAAGYEARGEWGPALLDVEEAISIAVARGRSRMDDLWLQRARLRARVGDVEGAAADRARAMQAVQPPPARSGP